MVKSSGLVGWKGLVRRVLSKIVTIAYSDVLGGWHCPQSAGHELQVSVPSHKPSPQVVLEGKVVVVVLIVVEVEVEVVVLELVVVVLVDVVVVVKFPINPPAQIPTSLTLSLVNV